MSSYNRVNGTHANENEHLLREILRDEWGYGGVVVSDWAGCNDRVAGLKAGNELEMPCCRYGNEDIVRAVKEGRLDEKIVNESLERLLDLIFETDGALKDAPEPVSYTHLDVYKRQVVVLFTGCTDSSEKKDMFVRVSIVESVFFTAENPSGTVERGGDYTCLLYTSRCV